VSDSDWERVRDYKNKKKINPPPPKVNQTTTKLRPESIPYLSLLVFFLSISFLLQSLICTSRSHTPSSQGAQVVHLGAKLLPAATAAKVRAAVLFGDPYRGQALQAISPDSVVTYCFETDLICDGAPVVLPAHLAYGVYAAPAAGFVVARVS
jgi:Cutinase